MQELGVECVALTGNAIVNLKIFYDTLSVSYDICIHVTEPSLHFRIASGS